MQSDIEVYLLSCPTNEIVNWIQHNFNIITNKQVNSELHSLTVLHKSHEYSQKHITVQILEQAAGKRFTSVWFDTTPTPWKTDIDCARDAHAMLACEVRCNMAGWQESGDEDPDQWWRINQYEEGPFIWR